MSNTPTDPNAPNELTKAAYPPPAVSTKQPLTKELAETAVRGYHNYLLMSVYNPPPRADGSRWGLLAQIWEKLTDPVSPQKPENLCGLIAEHDMPFYPLKRIPNKDGKFVERDGSPALDEDGKRLFPQVFYKIYTRAEMAEILRKEDKDKFEVALLNLKKQAFPPDNMGEEARRGIWIWVIIAAQDNYTMTPMLAVPPPQREAEVDANGDSAEGYDAVEVDGSDHAVPDAPEAA